MFLNADYLGRFQLTYWDDQQSEFVVLPLPPTIKSQSLLAYIILHREKNHSREKLMDMFWENSPSKKARQSLSTTLWHIRKCFSDHNPITGNSKSIKFRFDGKAKLDVDEFEKNVSRGTLPNLRDAISLYKGEFLDGFFDDWVISERYRIQSLFIESLAKLMVLQEETGDYGQARNSAQLLLELDALREDAHQLLMRVYCALGQRNKALEQYNFCRQILRDELKVDPTVETINLFQDIHNGNYEIGIAVSPDTESSSFNTSATIRSPLDVVARPVLIGREKELASLKNLLAGQCTLALVVGEAGVGKTCLLESFAESLIAQGTCVLWGRCYEFERLLPYQPIAEALRPILTGMSDDELSSLPEWVVDELGNLIPDMPTRQTKSEGRPSNSINQDQAHLFSGVLNYLSVLSSSNPLLLVLEDLHWAAESTLELLHYLIHHAASLERPIFVIGSYRPESLGEQHSLWAFQRQLQRSGLAHSINLSPLSSEDVEQMLTWMSGRSNAIIPLARKLYRETEGNPFFLMELIKALFEMDAIAITDGAWQGDFDRISKGNLPLPDSISGVILGRVRRMGNAAQEALSIASILGRRFDFDLLTTIWGQSDDLTLDALGEMLRCRVVEESMGTTDRDYVFSHHKIQEVVYEKIPRQRRQKIHGQVGMTIEKYFSPQLDQLINELSHHYLQAQQFDNSLTAKASYYLNQAGNQAAKQFANVDALAYYNRALELIPESDHKKRFNLLSARERVFDLQGNRKAQREDQVSLWKLAQELTQEQQAEVKLREARYGREVGDYETAIDASLAAIDLANADQDILIAEGNLIMGQALIRQGKIKVAQPRIKQGFEMARKAGASWLEASCLNNLGLSYYYLGEPDEASLHLENAANIFRQIEDLRGLSATLNNLGVLYNQQGDFKTAKTFYEDALEIYFKMGNRKGEGMALNNLGVIAFAQGDYYQAKQDQEKALAIARDHQQQLFEGNALLNLGNVHLSLGAHTKAIEYIEAALDIYQQIGNKTGQGWALAYISLHAERLGNFEAALTNAQESLRIAEEIGDRHLEGLAGTHLGHAMLGLAHSDAALEVFQRAADLRRELGETHLAIESLSGVLRVYFQQKRWDDVSSVLDEIMEFFENNSLEGVDEPLRIYLTCYQALSASNVSRDYQLLNIAHTLLQDQAKKITDEALRSSFQENVPAHRELAAAFARFKPTQ